MIVVVGWIVRAFLQPRMAFSQASTTLNMKCMPNKQHARTVTQTQWAKIWPINFDDVNGREFLCSWFGAQMKAMRNQ